MSDEESDYSSESESEEEESEVESEEEEEDPLGDVGNCVLLLRAILQHYKDSLSKNEFRYLGKIVKRLSTK